MRNSKIIKFLLMLMLVAALFVPSVLCVQATDDANEAASGDGDLILAIVPAVAQGRSGQTKVSFNQGRSIEYPDWLYDADGELFEVGPTGGYRTSYFTVNGKVAYCLQSHLLAPPTGEQAAQEYESNVLLQKVLYYGYGGPGDITGSYFSRYNDDEKYILTHIAASYAYMKDTGPFDGKTGTNFAFYGCSKAGKEIVEEFVKELYKMPAPGELKLTIQPEEVTASVAVTTGVQTTPDITLTGDKSSYIEFTVPQDMKCFVAGEDGISGTARVYGGQSFYFTAGEDKNGQWSSGSVGGNYTNIWRTLIISNSNAQDIGYAEFYEESKNALQFKVNWNDIVQLCLIKEEKGDPSQKLEGATFGVYKDSECGEESLITELITDAAGEASAFLNTSEYGTIVYLKELAAPAGYVLDSQVQEIDLKDAGNAVFTFTAENEKTEVKVSKLDSENGSQLAGAKLEILDADGNVVRSWVSTTKTEVITGLPNGDYTLCETAAPDGYQLAKPIAFTIREDGIVISDALEGENTLVMKDQKIVVDKNDKDKNEKQDTKTQNTVSVETGDHSMMGLWLALVVVSGLGLNGIIRYRKRRG